MKLLFSAMVATMATVLTAVFLTPWGQPLNYVLVWIVFFGLTYVAVLAHREQGKAAQIRRTELREKYRARPAQSQAASDWLVRHMVVVTAAIALVVFVAGLYVILRFI